MSIEYPSVLGERSHGAGVAVSLGLGSCLGREVASGGGNWCINKAIIKHRNWKVFKTVNNSRLIWDKPKRLLCGHINIRTFISECEQVKHLLQQSNLDFLAIFETWLNENSPHATIK